MPFSNQNAARKPMDHHNVSIKMIVAVVYKRQTYYLQELRSTPTRNTNRTFYKEIADSILHFPHGTKWYVVVQISYNDDEKKRCICCLD